MRRIIGVNTWVWTSPLTDESLAELAPRIAGMGFGAIELPLENAADWDAARARDLLAGLGLAPVVIGAMGPGRSLVDRAGNVPATQEYLRTCLATAQQVGAAVVAGPFYAPTGVTWRMTADERTEVVAQLRRNLRPLIDEAADAGIMLGIEPLNRYETSVVNTVAQGLDAFAPLFGPGLGLALDTYHLNIEEKLPEAAIRAASGHIAHVQVCGSDRGTVGDDHTDWPATLAALDDAGYDGILGLESFTGANATIAVAASVWRPLAPSQDELATRSLAYLNALQPAP
ncbi:sugar phosphate isomerase/epimerase family protein [Microbacterium invictum]|uniref:D-psicose/D-tagatose/L-ribulose 3-epimerase n=1 Tax=Microbacterium invictum TaxID=515415 RepID=A0AA40VL87_9MICO|nr:MULTISPECIES: sugar phosphate isomerase/epimerase [Microbacterium]MBB4138334.1 D-psicose/D-tagatose/L-ribulose 3-epimerase [Microbacterium invictum]